MIGISLNRKQRIWGCFAIILAVATIAIVIGRDDKPAIHGKASTPGADNDGIAENGVAAIPVVAQKRPKSTQTEKIAGPSVAEEPLTDPAELEQAFIDEALQAMPKLIEVEVHEPGVVFFRFEPDRPEALEQAMEDLAERYKALLDYNEPVNVVFFISGRPAKARVFFRE